MISLDVSEDFTKNYKLLIGGVLPRPIALVSTLNENGSANLAPFSFFTVISAKPMIMAFCPLVRSSDNTEKDTPLNIKREKEFVINIVSTDIAEKVNLCATELDHGESEFELSGLNTLKSEIVKAPRVAESKIHYECKLRDILSYGETAGAGQMITGEVVKIHVSEEVYEQGKINCKKLDPIGRGSGNDWVRCTDLVSMNRKQKAQIQD